MPTTTEPPFFCGEFGHEVRPLVVALDRRSGELAWRSCTERPLPPGALASAPALLWSSSVFMSFSGIGIGTVDALDPMTGKLLWSHPAMEWSPAAVVEDVVIEARGIGFTESVPGAHPADTGKARLRAVRAGTYEILWEQDVRVVVELDPHISSITAGAGLVAVCGPATTVLLDVMTGEMRGEENGQWRADRDLLIADRAGQNGVMVAVRTPEGANLSFGLDVQRVGYGTSTSDLIVSRGGTDNRIVDRSTLLTKWVIEGGGYIAGSFGLAAVVDRSRLQLRDGADGDVVWTHDLSAYGVQIADVEIGESLVLVALAPAL